MYTQVEFLKRIGIAGTWDELQRFPWEEKQKCVQGRVSVDGGVLCRSAPGLEMKEKARTVGHIFRLASGNPSQEKEVNTHSGESKQHSERHSARLEGIVSFLDGVGMCRKLITTFWIFS